MTRQIALTGMALAVCFLAAAQDDNGDRVVVPARDTSLPRMVEARLFHGNITVKTYGGKEVIVETRGSTAGANKSAPTVDGMKRIDLPRRTGLQVEEMDNGAHHVIHVVGGRDGHPGDLEITVPVDTSLKLNSAHGRITVNGVHGEVDANCAFGAITLTNVSGTVVANSSAGPLRVTMDRVDPAKPLSFSTAHGSIDVTLPANIKASVKLKTVSGDIYSDFDIKLAAGQWLPARSNRGGGGTRTAMARAVRGTINGGGTEVDFYTVNGRILIRKK